MQHFYQGLPGWASFSELYSHVVRTKAQDGMIFVEVGSWLGRSAAFMAVELINKNVQVDFYCVDPWTDGGIDLRDTNHFKSLDKPVYDTFLENIKPVQHIIKPLRMTSVEGAAHFDDRSLDFVMLDGEHTYEAIRADIDAWLPKMKVGSIISGDDYLWPGVNRAANETFGRLLHPVIKKQAKDYKKSIAHWWVQL